MSSGAYLLCCGANAATLGMTKVCCAPGSATCAASLHTQYALLFLLQQEMLSCRLANSAGIHQ